MSDWFSGFSSRNFFRSFTVLLFLEALADSESFFPEFPVMLDKDPVPPFFFFSPCLLLLALLRVADMSLDEFGILSDYMSSAIYLSTRGVYACYFPTAGDPSLAVVAGLVAAIVESSSCLHSSVFLDSCLFDCADFSD